MKPFLSTIVRVLAMVALVLGGLSNPAWADEDTPWHTVDDQGNVEIHLYFAYSTTCPHCQEAMPFLGDLEDEHEWLTVHRLPLNTGNLDAVDRATTLAESIGESLRFVPTFMYCETLVSGYDSSETTGVAIEAGLVECHAQMNRQPVIDGVEEQEAPITLPIVGDVDPQTVSLPMFTLVIASLDAFNPCAFFVLLFLLSILVHARSRSRMAAIGATFVIVSGLVYFAFMVAWLNVFLLVGGIPVVTLAAGAIAVLIAILNIKEYFWFQQGPTLSIPEGAKPGLFRRMRTLTMSTSFPLMMTGAVTLALAANSYELLCTAGFPLVFTRVLTLNDLPTYTYYAYLVLYNVVYVIPLLVIVGVFVGTLGSRQLTEQGGRTLKLLSGLMMLGLGTVLLFVPELLENLATAPLVLLAALALTLAIVLIDRGRRVRGTNQIEGVHR